MANESWYQETERVLRQYWLQRDRLERLRTKETAILAAIKNFEMEIVELKEAPNITAKYGVAPGGCWDHDPGYAKLMVAYNEQIVRIQSELLKQYKKLHSLHSRISNLEIRLAPIEHIVEKLTEQQFTIMEQRYVYRRNNTTIANMMHCDESTVRYHLQHAVRNTAFRLGKLGRRDFPEFIPKKHNDNVV